MFASFRSDLGLKDYECKIQAFQGDHLGNICPIMESVAWKDLCLKEDLLRSLREQGFQHPSEVQCKAIPPILSGSNLLCQAKAGSGKTLVFVIGILHMIASQSPMNDKPCQCIVVAHTREMAHQIFKVFKQIGIYLSNPMMRYGCYFGGTPREQNQKDFKENRPHVVIGSPGRLLDLVDRRSMSLKDVRYVVVDECDHLFSRQDSGTIVEVLMQKCPIFKQVMMFSATISSQVKNRIFKNVPEMLMIGQKEEPLHLQGLNQYYTQVNQSSKANRLCHFLDTFDINQAIIFVNSVDTSKKLCDFLRLKMFNPLCIHSGLRQQQRILCYQKFKKNFSRILVATDLFGRGIDIQRVNFVINYDMPRESVTYLHRVGRAGRFFTGGTVINFLRNPKDDVNNNDREFLTRIEEGLKIKIKLLPSQIKMN